MAPGKLSDSWSAKRNVDVNSFFANPVPTPIRQEVWSLLPGLCRGPWELRKGVRSARSLCWSPCALLLGTFPGQMLQASVQAAVSNSHTWPRAVLAEDIRSHVCVLRGADFCWFELGVRAHRRTQVAERIRGACAWAGHQPAQPCPNWWCGISNYQVFLITRSHWGQGRRWMPSSTGWRKPGPQCETAGTKGAAKEASWIICKVGQLLNMLPRHQFWN